MSATQFLAFAAWPLIIIGLMIGRATKRKRDAGERPHWIWTAFAATFVCVPAFALMVLSHYAASLLFSQHLMMFVIGMGLLVSVWRQPGFGFRQVFLSFVGFGCLAYSAWNIVGDYLIRPRYVEAIITNVEQYNNPTSNRSLLRYYVALGGNSYRTTYDIFSKVEAGQRIRAQIGRGSGMILAIEPLPF